MKYQIDACPDCGKYLYPDTIHTCTPKDAAREAFDRLYGHLLLSGQDAAWHVFKSGWEAREQQSRQALQAAGTHPAPCARHCEANAFEVAARGMRRQITELQEALESARGQPVAQIDTSAERVEKEAANKHVRPPNCGTGYCSCIECLKGTP